MDKQEIDWGGPAFPSVFEIEEGNEYLGVKVEHDIQMVNHGMDLRIYIAIRAMQALIPIAEVDRLEPNRTDLVANAAVRYADALLKRLGEDDANE